jgi:hypothetical protein
MRSIYDFIITPKKSRYNNTKKIGDKELILNTEIFNHQYVSREAIVKYTPLVTKTKIQQGDEVIVHHNVFRRWHNVKGIEKNSRSYIDENTYAVKEDQIFLYKHNNTWCTLKGYCFIKPIKSNDKFGINKERPLIGIMKYTDKDLPNINNGDLVGFIPDIEYEFIIDGERLYRVLTQFITIKYEYQGDEEEYNPSWTQSC